MAKKETKNKINSEVENHEHINSDIDTSSSINNSSSIGGQEQGRQSERGQGRQLQKGLTVDVLLSDGIYSIFGLNGEVVIINTYKDGNKHIILQSEYDRIKDLIGIKKWEDI